MRTRALEIEISSALARASLESMFSRGTPISFSCMLGNPVMAKSMRRVLVIGSGGSGKSTLATLLGKRSGLPVIHLDALYWRPGWVATPDEEWRRTVAELAERPEWIMDGNYGGTLDLRLASCDTVIFLDVPRWICISRVVRRWVRYAGRTRPEMSTGCPERITWEFLRWIWNYPTRRRARILSRLALLPAAREVRVLRSRADVESFLSDVEN